MYQAILRGKDESQHLILSGGLFLIGPLRPPQLNRFEAVAAGQEAVGEGNGGHLAEVLALDRADRRATHVRVQEFYL